MLQCASLRQLCRYLILLAAAFLLTRPREACRHLPSMSGIGPEAAAPRSQDDTVREEPSGDGALVVAELEASQLSQLSPTQNDAPAEVDDRLGFIFRPSRALLERRPDPLIQVLAGLQGCTTEDELGCVLEPSQLFLECETADKLYRATFAMLERAVAQEKDLCEIGDDPGFDFSLVAPRPIIIATQTICAAQGWCVEGSLQGRV